MSGQGVNGSAPAGEQPPPPSGAASGGLPPPAPSQPWWTDHLSATGRALYDWVSQPRVRLVLVGVTLLLIGGLVMASSVWTLPFVVVGALMVVVAWVGRRLDGRFAIEWGEAGTQLEFRARIRAPEPAAALPARASSATNPLPRAGEPKRDEVIDGQAHTVEIEVAELEALIAAVETRKART